MPAQQGGGRGVGLTAGRSAVCPLHDPSGGPPPPRYARWRTSKILLATRSAPEFCVPPQRQEDSPPARKREAKRREAHCPTNCRLRGSASMTGRARLSALHRGAHHRLLPRWLSSRTGFPEVSSSQVFCPLASSPRLSTLRADRSFCRPTGAPEPPGSGSHQSARGHRTRSVFAAMPSGKAPSMSEIRWCCNVNGDDCQDDVASTETGSLAVIMSAGIAGSQPGNDEEPAIALP
jgi:hypothetical protein